MKKVNLIYFFRRLFIPLPSPYLSPSLPSQGSWRGPGVEGSRGLRGGSIFMKQIPDQSFWKLWNISFGFFGVQIAYALQSANISRIFSTLGADPHNLSYFWILPPLMMQVPLA